MTFHYLIESTLDIFSSFTCSKLDLPIEFSSHVHEEQEGLLTLENHFFQVANFGQLRFALTHAPKINIIAIFFFPEPIYQLPVYSMEFVMLGQKPIIALIDTVCLIQPNSSYGLASDFMSATHSAYPTFINANNIPQWFDECRSGQEFFIRPDESNEFIILGEIHLLLVENLTKLFQPSKMYDDNQTLLHKHSLESYKHHHRINSPGLRLMNRSFGEKWTSKYLEYYLFA